MKKKILSLAVLMTIGVFAYAYTGTYVNLAEGNTMVIVQDDGYKTIELKDLNENVQKGVVAFEELYTIKSVEWNGEQELARITLISKLDESIKVVILDKEGKDLEAEPATSEEPGLMK